MLQLLRFTQKCGKGKVCEKLRTKKINGRLAIKKGCG